MPSTPIYALPYPAAADPADVPLDMQELADRVEAVLPTLAGRELSYVQFTTAVSITQNTESLAAVIVTADAVSFDGVVPALVEFFCPYVRPPTVANANVRVTLWRAGVDLGRLGQVVNPSGAVADIPFYVARRLVPSAGTAAFQIRAWVSTPTATFNVGAGGAGVDLPGFVRITRA